MGLPVFIQNQLDRLKQALLDRLNALIQPVISAATSLWDTLKRFLTALITVIPDTINLVEQIIDEVNAWRNFRQGIDIPFRTGVVSLKEFRKRIETAVNDVINAWRSLEDLFTSGFKLPIKSINEAAEAVDEVVTAVEDLFGKIGLQEFFARIVPQVKKAESKVLEVLALIEAVAEEAVKVIGEISSIVTAVSDVREIIQGGGELFLKQTNPRKTVFLTDGTSMKIRIGNLHEPQLKSADGKNHIKRGRQSNAPPHHEKGARHKTSKAKARKKR